MLEFVQNERRSLIITPECSSKKTCFLNFGMFEEITQTAAVWGKRDRCSLV